MKQKKRTGRRLLSFLLTLVMVIGLMPGMKLTAHAATDTYTTLKNDLTVVQFNSYNWYVIEDNSASATEGTLTLLAADDKFGLSMFSDNNSIAYSSSKIKAALDAMTAEGGAFADVADAIVSTDLADVSVTGAKLYLLSTSEAQKLNSTILNYNFPNSAMNGAWWLRSPGNIREYPAFVFGENGTVFVNGSIVDKMFGVRPALKLNLSSVVFSDESNSFSLKPAHTHSFTYEAGTGENANTITATCSAEDCPLTDKTATLTIAPSSTGGNTAEWTGDDVSEFDLTDVTITYQKKVSGGWQDTEAPGSDASGIFKASVALKGTDNVEATAFVTYGVSAVTHGTATNPTGKSYDFTVPKVAAVGAKIRPTPTTTLDTGYGIKKITVKDENQNDVSTSVEADTEGFIMPEYNVKVDVEFGLIDYKITKNDMSNGSVTVKKGENEVTTAHYGDTITLIATPDTDFALSSLTVKDSNNMIELSGSGNTRTFRMPAYNVTVSATFEGAPYNLTIPDAITGGTVTAAGSGIETTNNVTTAKAGTEVTLIVTPSTGFNFDSLTVTKTADNSAVSVKKESATIYTFTMPQEAVSVSATFVRKTVTASLGMTGNAGTTCTAAILDENYNEINSVVKKAGEKFILLVNRDDEYDFTVTGASTKEFSDEEYQKYYDNAKNHNTYVSLNTVLLWVTMPGNQGDSATVTVTFKKLQTYTILYQPQAGTAPEMVACKIARTVKSVEEVSYMFLQRGAAMDDGTAVWSLKMTAAFPPEKIVFVPSAIPDESSKESWQTNLENATPENATVRQDATWTDITGGGKYLIIGGNAKVVTAVFITDASTMSTYKDNTADAPEAAGGATYQLAVCGTDAQGNVTSFGNVQVPAAPTIVPEGKEFVGWRGFKYQTISSKATEETYSAGANINIRENATFNAVWKPAALTVTMGLNGGTGGSNVTSVTYGNKLTISENPTRDGYAFDGWTVSETVTENGVAFAKGSSFDLDTPITANLKLTAQWKHVHSFSCYQISAFGDRLAKYQKYEKALHIVVCGCGDLDLVAHEFDNDGKCACGYQKPPAPDVTLNISYGQWSNNAYTEKMQGMPETAKQGQEVSVYAPATWGDLQFSKWQYSAGDGKWVDLTAQTYASFIIPVTMYVRALYINPVTVPQVDLSVRSYDDQAEVDGQTYTMGNILFHLNYKLPDGYTFEDAGIRLGDNNGISYYFIQQVKYSYDNESKGIISGIAAGVSALDFFTGNVNAYDVGKEMFAEGYSVNYLETEDNVLDKELDAATLAKYMYESKPVNVEKYDPVYWQAKAVTKGRSGSIETIPPLRFAQKYGGRHYIYGIGWLRYKDKDGKTHTVYTDALPAAVKNMPNYSVTKSGS